jgi:DNA-binding transcriptional MerR regulator
VTAPNFPPGEIRAAFFVRRPAERIKRSKIREGHRSAELGGKHDEVFQSIGEVAESLDLPAHVLRFWETRFRELEPLKRAGGRRYYRARDVELLKALRHLLYGQGYTIRGVQRILREQGATAVIASVREGRAPPEADVEAPPARRAEPVVDLPPREPAPERRLEPAPAAPASPPGVAGLPALIAEPDYGPAGLGDEDIRQLRLALADLAECRRLLTLIK